MKTAQKLLWLAIALILFGCSQNQGTTADASEVSESNKAKKSTKAQLFLIQDAPPGWEKMSIEEQLDYALDKSTSEQISSGQYVLLPALEEIKVNPKGTHFPKDMELTLDIQTEFRFFALHDNKSVAEVEAEADRRIQQYQSYQNAARYQQYVAGFAALRYLREVESGNSSARTALAKCSAFLEQLDAHDTYIRAKCLLALSEDVARTKSSDSKLASLKKRATEELNKLESAQTKSRSSVKESESSMSKSFSAPAKHRWEQTLALLN